MFESAKQAAMHMALKSLLTMAASHEEATLAKLHYDLTTHDWAWLPDTIEKPTEALIEAAAKEAYDWLLGVCNAAVNAPAPAGPPAP